MLCSEIGATKADEKHHVHMTRTFCTPLSHRAALCPRLTQQRIRFHARTFQAFEAGSSDAIETRGAAAGNFHHLLASSAPRVRDCHCHFTRHIRCSYAQNAAHAGFIKAAIHQNVPISATVGGLYKLLTCKATYRSPAGVQLHQGGVEGVEGVHEAAWTPTCTLLLEGGYELLGGWVSNNLSLKLFSAAQGGWMIPYNSKKNQHTQKKQGGSGTLTYLYLLVVRSS